jgi:hypothetical protein
MDNMAEISYNTDNANDDVTPETDTVVEKIDKSKLPHVTVPGCLHLRTETTPSDEFEGDVFEVSCLDCPVGWHIKQRV